jgi:hypothetical protein
MYKDNDDDTQGSEFPYAKSPLCLCIFEVPNMNLETLRCVIDENFIRKGSWFNRKVLLSLA